MKAFGSFVVVGGLAALVNVLSRVALNQFISYEASIIIAYMIGMTFAYYSNRIFVFKPTGQANVAEYVRFGIVNIASMSMVFGVSLLFSRIVFPAIEFRWHAETIAHAIGVASPIFLSFFAHRNFSFASKNQ
jgi:putative flippase GtrA